MGEKVRLLPSPLSIAIRVLFFWTCLAILGAVLIATLWLLLALGMMIFHNKSYAAIAILVCAIFFCSCMLVRDMDRQAAQEKEKEVARGGTWT